MRGVWRDGRHGLVDPALHARVARTPRRAAALARAEWRDQINTYFFRKSGVPDARGRRHLLSCGEGRPHHPVGPSLVPCSPEVWQLPKTFR